MVIRDKQLRRKPEAKKPDAPRLSNKQENVQNLDTPPSETLEVTRRLW